MVIGTALTAVLTAVLGAGSAGALAGVGVRVVLARTRRGVLVPALPTAGALAALWAAPAGVVAAGLVPGTWLPTWLVLGVVVVAGSATDLVARRLPDAVTVPGAVLALAALVPLGAGHLGAGLVGAVVLGGAFAAVHLAAPGALGAGDVKLAPALGAPLAAASWGGLLAAPVLAAVGVLVLVLAGGARRVPYGPPLLAATWLTLAATVIAR
ncbi:prepilin peptidase [Actinomycetospora callitridis]|uniref:prepilin peptidase n=1 Tax=Actinomycetospora callitridis TaxID=913944 RepID=UPI002365300C|nr:prepilin peptidase [Actinomycetospora callitridis]MDD7918559.1 prepilin peptidase [Actinomycetospora callitridis]